MLVVKIYAVFQEGVQFLLSFLTPSRQKSKHLVYGNDSEAIFFKLKFSNLM